MNAICSTLAWAPYDLHGAALLDCYRGDRAATLVCHQDGARDDVPAAFWLRDEPDLLETMALNLCRGRVLDLGAGAGLHALELQRRGLEVTAIDISPACVAIMKDRGVCDARTADLFSFAGGPFDTIVSLCNGLDKVGRLRDLPAFFDRMRTLLAPGGMLLADSFDVRVGASPERLANMAVKALEGRYFGESDLRFEYRERVTDLFSVLHVDFDTLTAAAEKAGWESQWLAGNAGHYLFRARPSR